MASYKTPALLALGLSVFGLSVFGCGGEATRTIGREDANGDSGSGGRGDGGGQSTPAEGDGGHAQVARACTTSAECGSLTCLCGTCESACDRTADCSRPSGSRCVGDPLDPGVLDASIAFELRDHGVLGSDLALGPDSSVFVVGGITPAPLDLGAVQYQDFWLGAVDAQGTLRWQTVEPLDADESPGLSIALEEDGTLFTLGTKYVEGARTHVRKFDAQGTRISEEYVTPEMTVARTLPSQGGVWLGGAELVEWRVGRPFTRAQVDRAGVAAGSGWPASFAGLSGSVSSVVDLALDDAGNASLSGYLGIDSESNRSVPWVARINADGEPIFQVKVAVSDDSHCRADSVAVTSSGTTLAAGSCEGNWLKAFSPSGALLWERRFPNPVTAVTTTATGGYVVATGVTPPGSYNPDDIVARAELWAFDAEHHLIYGMPREGCTPFHRLRAVPGGVVALGACLGDVLIGKYEAR